MVVAIVAKIARVGWALLARTESVEWSAGRTPAQRTVDGTMHSISATNFSRRVRLYSIAYSALAKLRWLIVVWVSPQTRSPTRRHTLATTVRRKNQQFPKRVKQRLDTLPDHRRGQCMDDKLSIFIRLNHLVVCGRRRSTPLVSEVIAPNDQIPVRATRIAMMCKEVLLRVSIQALLELGNVGVSEALAVLLFDDLQADSAVNSIKVALSEVPENLVLASPKLAENLFDRQFIDCHGSNGHES